MYFPTASLSITALSFLMTAIHTQVIDSSNIQPSPSISTTSTEPQQNSAPHTAEDQASCTVVVNGQTHNICNLRGATKSSSTTAAPHTVPTDFLQRSCMTTISGTVHDLCNVLLVSGDSSAKPTMQPHDSPDQKACSIMVNGASIDICNTESAAAAPSVTAAP